MTELDEKKRKKRSVVIALLLVGFVLLIYAISIIRLGDQVLNRAL